MNTAITLGNTTPAEFEEWFSVLKRRMEYYHIDYFEGVMVSPVRLAWEGAFIDGITVLLQGVGFATAQRVLEQYGAEHTEEEYFTVTQGTDSHIVPNYSYFRRDAA